jgi:hypothetical protein
LIVGFGKKLFYNKTLMLFVSLSLATLYRLAFNCACLLITEDYGGLQGDYSWKNVIPILTI